MISVIIPIYNGESTIEDCLASLCRQSFMPLEIIAVDDGSTDETGKVIKEFIRSHVNCRVRLFRIVHTGPGLARNFGAKCARGRILVFADSDMTFDPDFLDKLTRPIFKGKTKGTFSREEEVANWQKPLARCWNYFNGLKDKSRISKHFEHTSPVFRAILKSEFRKIGGFDPIGYTDDWTLSRKLGFEASKADGAKYYHINPETLPEVFRQARWIGKNEFISGTVGRRIFNLFRYSPFYQLPRAVYLYLKFRQWQILPLTIVYSLAVTFSVMAAFFSEQKYK